MGAFGYTEFDNDTALDWVGATVTCPIEKVLISKNPNPDKLRAAIRIACILQTEKIYVDLDALKTGIKSLEKLQKNKTWVETWDNEEEINESLRILHSKLRFAISSHPWNQEK
jgi:hypothetical protein